MTRLVRLVLAPALALGAALTLALIGVFAGLPAASVPRARAATAHRTVTCRLRYYEAFRASRTSCSTARTVATVWGHRSACLIGDGYGSPARRRCVVRGWHCQARLGTAPPPLGGSAALVVCTRERGRISFAHPV